MNFRDMRLRTKLALWVVCLVVLLTAVMMIVVEYRERKAIETQVRKRGMTIAQNLGAVSTNALVTYNYIMLEQQVGRLAQEEDLVYVIILDREGRVAAHSQHGDLQGQHLTDLVSRRASEANEPLIQSAVDPQQGNILEVAIPVFPSSGHGARRHLAARHVWGNSADATHHLCLWHRRCIRRVSCRIALGTPDHFAA
jgi:sensor histidine kinase regulating citrate/malate metabolism